MRWPSTTRCDRCPSPVCRAPPRGRSATSSPTSPAPRAPAASRSRARRARWSCRSPRRRSSTPVQGRGGSSDPDPAGARVGARPISRNPGRRYGPDTVADPAAPLLVHYDGSRLNSGRIHYVIEQLYKRAGIRSVVPAGALVHALRHSVASAPSSTAPISSSSVTCSATPRWRRRAAISTLTPAACAKPSPPTHPSEPSTRCADYRRLLRWAAGQQRVGDELAVGARHLVRVR